MDNGRSAHRHAHSAGVINHQLLAGLHLAQIFHGLRIGHAIPDGLALPLQIRKGIDVRLSLQQKWH